MNDTTPHTSTIVSLYIEALRQKQPLWFRVASNSMLPLLRKDDSVYIEPAQAEDIRIGDIAAFETSSGLVIHRIVAIAQTHETIRLLQMSDVEVLPTWVKQEAVVGRVITVRRQKYQLALRHPIAKWCGKVTAVIRYRLYKYRKNIPLRMVMRIASRLAIRLGYWCIRCVSAPPQQ
jgi:translation initiation factor 2 gamma subunit (eIF-2gamma)